MRRLEYRGDGFGLRESSWELEKEMEGDGVWGEGVGVWGEGGEYGVKG